MTSAVLARDIPADGILPLLSEIEERRTTGVLRFEAGDLAGEVALVAGQIALNQKPLAEGRDPVDALLSLRTGRFEVFQRLPPLPVTKGDDLTRGGSLAVHVPADVMNYCERSGLTGTLTFEREGSRALAVYDGGELVEIHVDGRDDDDLNEVFGWEKGSFEIRALTERPIIEVPEEPVDAAEPGGREETGQQFLHSVQVALSSIVDERERRRSASRTGPPLPPPPKARRPDSLPGLAPAPDPERFSRRSDQTVRVVYLGARAAKSPRDSGTRHVEKNLPREEVLPEAKPERRDSSEAPTGTLIGTLGWVAVVVLLMVAGLAVLAHLPALE